MGEYGELTRCLDMSYVEKKTQVRQMAIDWQIKVSEGNYSCAELAYWTACFEMLGRRYGLLREFRENGIC